MNISRLWGPPLWATRSAQPTPAQQTEIRSPPSASAAWPTAAATASASVTSVATKLAASPSSAASASPFSALRSAIVTRRARLGQRPRGRLAKPGGAARDQRRCPLDPHRPHPIRPALAFAVNINAGFVEISPPGDPTCIGFSHRHRGEAGTTKEAIAERLAEAPRRTLGLIEPLDDEQLNRVYSPLLSPLAWDLGHIANFEELWLVQTIGGREPLHGDLGRFYDAIENPRKTRGELPILRDAELRAYLADVRARTLEVLDGIPEIGVDAEDPLLREGFVYEMLLAHEFQHNETMLQLLQMVDDYEALAEAPAPGGEPASRRARDDRGRGGRLRDRRRPAGLRLRQRAPPPRGRARRLSRSTAHRSPTAPTRASSRRPAPSRRCTGSATARGAGRGARWVAPSRSIRAGRRPRLLGRGRRLRALGREAAADRAGVGGGERRAWTASARPGNGPRSDFLAYPGFEAVPLPRVLGGLLRRRPQGAARRLLGDPPRA